MVRLNSTDSYYLLERILYLQSGSDSRMSSYRRQEKGVLKSHDCVLIYKSETEGDESPTPDSSLIRLTTSMLKVKRLEEISSCHSSNPLEKVAFFSVHGRSGEGEMLSGGKFK